MLSNPQHLGLAVAFLLALFPIPVGAVPIDVIPVGEVVILFGLESESLVIVEPLALAGAVVTPAPGKTYEIEPGTTDTVSDIITYDPEKKLAFQDSDKIFDDPEDKGVLPKEPRTFDHDVDGCCGFLPVGAKSTPEGQFTYKGQTYEAVYFALLSSDPGFDTERSSPVTYLIVGDLAVPEPASIVLLGMGIALLAAYRRRN